MAAVALGAAVCSCSTDILDQPEFNGSEMMVEASGFDGKDAASYISWIKISRQGTGELTYRTELKYAEGCDTLLPAIPFSPTMTGNMYCPCRKFVTLYRNRN